MSNALLNLIPSWLYAVVVAIAVAHLVYRLTRFMDRMYLHWRQGKTPPANVVEFTRRQQLDALIEAPLSAIRRKP
jgi:hypothetical protein